MKDVATQIKHDAMFQVMHSIDRMDTFYSVWYGVRNQIDKQHLNYNHFYNKIVYERKEL